MFLNIVNDVHREADAAMSVGEQQRFLLIQSEKKVDLHDYCHHTDSRFSHWLLTDGAIVLDSYMNERRDNGNEARPVRHRNGSDDLVRGSSYVTITIDI